MLRTKKAPPLTPQDIDRTPVAKDIWCYSTKEKTFTWHVVVNHDENGFVDRVQCKVSKTIHKYRRQNKPVSTTLKKVVRKSSSSKAAPKLDFEELWYRGIRNWSTKVIKSYSPQTPLQNGDVFNHPNFGKGVVHARRDNKIDVLFKEGPKVLLNAKE